MRTQAVGVRRYCVDALAVFGLALGVYLLSAPRSVMLDDDGYFILAAWFNGVAHAPGYPLYTALAHLATWLPMGSVAFRVHAASALFGALACLCLWIISRQLAAGRAHALTAALCFAFSGTFWSQATVAEVYSLNALFFFGLMAFAQGLGRSTAPTPGVLRLFAFLCGLSLSNHWPLMALSAPALLAMLWPLRRELVRRLPSTALCGLLGLTPYLWMVVRSWNAEIAFHGPIDTPRELWFYLSREEYSHIDAAPGAGWDDRLRFAGFTLAELARQFGPPGLVLVMFGFWRQWADWPRHVAWAQVLGFLGSTFLLIILLGFEFDLRYQNVFRAYPIIAWGIAALWLGLGTNWAMNRLQSVAAGRARSQFLHWGAALAVAGSALAWNLPQNWRAGDTWARNYAQIVLDSLPQRARFFVFGDYATGPVAYLNLVENHRPDVSLYSVKGLLFKNRLFDAVGVDARRQFEAIDAFIRSSPDPVVYTPALPHQYSAIDYGLYQKVAPELPPSTGAAVLDPRIQSFLEGVLDRGPPRDPSELLHYREFTLHYCRLIGTLVEHGGGESSWLAGSLETRCSDYQGLLQRAEIALRGEPPNPTRALQLLADAAARANDAVTADNRAALDYLQGRASLLTGDEKRAAAHFAASISIWPAAENPAREFAPVAGPVVEEHE